MIATNDKCPYCDFPSEDQIGDVYVVEIIEQYNFDNPSGVPDLLWCSRICRVCALSRERMNVCHLLNLKLEEKNICESCRLLN